MKHRVWVGIGLMLIGMAVAQTSDDGRVELIEWRGQQQGDTVNVTLQLAVHFPNYVLPGMAIDGRPFQYQLLVQVEDNQGTLVYSRTINRRLPAYPLGGSDSLTVQFALPAGNYRFFVTPLHVPVYVQDLQGVPLILGNPPPIP